MPGIVKYLFKFQLGRELANTILFSKTNARVPSVVNNHTLCGCRFCKQAE